MTPATLATRLGIPAETMAIAAQTGKTTEFLRQHILSHEATTRIMGTKPDSKKAETLAELFERITGEPLEPPKRKRK